MLVLPWTHLEEHGLGSELGLRASRLSHESRQSDFRLRSRFFKRHAISSDAPSILRAVVAERSPALRKGSGHFPFPRHSRSLSRWDDWQLQRKKTPHNGRTVGLALGALGGTRTIWWVMLLKGDGGRVSLKLKTWISATFSGLESREDPHALLWRSTESVAYAFAALSVMCNHFCERSGQLHTLRAGRQCQFLVHSVFLKCPKKAGGELQLGIPDCPSTRGG